MEVHYNSEVYQPKRKSSGTTLGVVAIVRYAVGVPLSPPLKCLWGVPLYPLLKGEGGGDDRDHSTPVFLFYMLNLWLSPQKSGI